MPNKFTESERKEPTHHSRASLHRDAVNVNFNVWKCTDCGHRLGRLLRKRKVLLIKYRDLYVDVEGQGARVTMRCVNCGSQHTLGSETETKED